MTLAPRFGAPESNKGAWLQSKLQAPALRKIATGRGDFNPALWWFDTCRRKFRCGFCCLFTAKCSEVSEKDRAAAQFFVLRAAAGFVGNGPARFVRRSAQIGNG